MTFSTRQHTNISALEIAACERADGGTNNVDSSGPFAVPSPGLFSLIKHLLARGELDPSSLVLVPQRTTTTCGSCAEQVKWVFCTTPAPTPLSQLPPVFQSDFALVRSA